MKDMLELGVNPNLISSHGMSLGKLQELVVDREAWQAVVHGITKSKVGCN